MLWKLSLTGIKGRFKDYLVLFFGPNYVECHFFNMFEAFSD